jgi:sarcosine oxidase subunit beta
MHAVVVGAGIVGLSSASQLARQGADVTVYEKGAIGRGSTPRSAGGVRTQFSTPVNVALSLASLPVWESFEDRFGVDVGFRQHGYLFLARTDETAAEFREQVRMQQELGVDSEYLTADELPAHCEGVREESFVAGTYCPRDGWADPHLALQGYADAAREAGATVHTHTPVTDVHRDGERVVGVQADGERVPAGVVVNAAGPWAHRVDAMAGVDLPVAPRRRQVAVVDPSDPIPQDAPLTIDLDTGAYFRPERDGQAIVGGHFAVADPTADPDRYRESHDVDWAATAIERAADAATYFGPDTRLVRGWAGLYAVTPDHHPIVDEVVPGYVTATGFSGHGFQHAPATGELVADLALDGETDLVDRDPLRADRFDDEGDRQEERNVA